VSEPGEPERPGEPGRSPDRDPGRGPTRLRLIVWIVVGAIALFLIATGVVGILQKGA
jgi:hypothetical protein